MSKSLQKISWATVMLLSIVVGAWAVKRQLPVRPHPVGKTAKASKTKAPKPTNIVENLVNIFIPLSSPAPTPATASATTANSTPAQAAVLPRRKPKPTPQINYGEAVSYYGNNRIQFDSSCHGIPSRMAVANPITLMLDNRSAGTQKILIAGKTYNVAAYNYVIVTIKEKTLPVHLMVNCNSSVNVTEIIVE